jgi:RNA polymerase sigma factor (sigma-70 family)
MSEQDKKFIQKVLDKGGVENEVFVKRYESYIWAIIHKKVGTHGLPEFIKKDIFQYVFIKIFDENSQALRNYVSEYSIPFKNYLSIFVGSRVLDYIRKEVKESSREVVLVDEAGENIGYRSALDEAPGPLEVVETIEFQESLRAFADQLSEKERVVFRLMSEGSSSGEIAEELKIDIKAIYKIVFKIKQDLRRKIVKDVA